MGAEHAELDVVSHREETSRAGSEMWLSADGLNRYWGLLAANPQMPIFLHSWVPAKPKRMNSMRLVTEYVRGFLYGREVAELWQCVDESV